MSDDDVAELKAFRAKAARNSRARARRVPGAGYRAMQVRQAAYAEHYAGQGTVTLSDLAYVATVHQNVLEAAVIRLVEVDGYSWTQVAAELGMSRAGAQKKYGPLVKGRTRGGQPAELR